LEGRRGGEIWRRVGEGGREGGGRCRDRESGEMEGEGEMERGSVKTHIDHPGRVAFFQVVEDGGFVEKG